MDPELKTILCVFAFGLGASIASFLNVVAWRVPRGESIVRPPSHCPKCNAPIRWWQNIPILSWLALRGRCANCRAPISPRYIVVETIGALLFLAVAWVFLPSVSEVLFLWIWCSLMLVGSVIDFDHKLLPDFVTVGGMVLGVAKALADSALMLVYGVDRVAAWLMPVAWSLSGLVFGFGLLMFIRTVGTKAFKREAMGMGDVFLMGAVGALFGPVAVLFTLIVSSVLGSVAGLSLVALAKTKFGRYLEIPYGPYICGACLVWIFFGPEIVNWYLSVMGL
ncbi:MAG: prepilin peptidase [Kiritimatiellae bacterium]|nr:prepilin peptidase [Kiritimatiellia bacterium]